MFNNVCYPDEDKDTMHRGFKGWIQINLFATTNTLSYAINKQVIN